MMTVAISSPADLARDQHRRRLGIVLCLLALLVLFSVIAIGVGPVTVSPYTTTRIIAHELGVPVTKTWSTSEHSIVWLIRIPRVILGGFVGAGLAASGVAIQALVRNPLADPYLLGLSSGASTGAAASILFGIGSGVFALTGSAFVGAVGAIALVLAIARCGGRLVSSRLVFAGIAVGFALTAVTNFLVFAGQSRDGARAVLFWMLGSLSQSRWSAVPLLAAGTLVSLALFVVWCRRFDALAIGDDTALSLGTDPTRFRTVAVLIVSLAVAVAVSVSGLIGFVGLVVPHLARRLVGGQHRVLFPTAAALGALLLVCADALARVAFAPRELPLGILTALIGTPMLIVLVRQSLAR